MKLRKFFQSSRFIIKSAIVILALIYLSSCNKAPLIYEKINASDVDDKNQQLTLHNNVIVLNEESLDFLTVDNQKITFSNSVNQTKNIEIGSIVSGAKLDGSEIINVFAKIISLKHEGDKLIAETTVPKLEEFIKEGRIYGEIDLNNESAFNVSSQKAYFVPIGSLTKNSSKYRLNARGANKGHAIQLTPLSFERNFSILSEGSIPPFQNVTANISGGFTPKIAFEISFKEGHVSDFKVNLFLDDLALKATVGVTGKVKGVISPMDFIDIPVLPIVLGSTGLILSPTVSAGPYIEVSAGGRGNFDLAEVYGDANFSLGIRPELKLNLQQKAPTIDTVTGNAELTPGVRIKSGFALFFTAIKISEVGISGKLSVKNSVDVTVGAKREVHLKSIANSDASIYGRIGTSLFNHNFERSIYVGDFTVYDKTTYF